MLDNNTGNPTSWHIHPVTSTPCVFNHAFQQLVTASFQWAIFNQALWNIFEFWGNLNTELKFWLAPPCTLIAVMWLLLSISAYWIILIHPHACWSFFSKWNRKKKKKEDKPKQFWFLGNISGLWWRHDTSTMDSSSTQECYTPCFEGLLLAASVSASQNTSYTRVPNASANICQFSRFTTK